MDHADIADYPVDKTLQALFGCTLTGAATETGKKKKTVRGNHTKTLIITQGGATAEASTPNHSRRCILTILINNDCYAQLWVGLFHFHLLPLLYAMLPSRAAF